MKAQVIFNKVAKHLLKQGAPAKDGEQCVYRAFDGKKCAVGCLISDKDYVKQMEGSPVDMVIYAFKLPHYFEKNVDLLCSLQEVHDECFLTKSNRFNKRHLLNGLRKVAHTHNLKCEF